MSTDDVVMVPMRRVPVGKHGAALGEAAPACKFTDVQVERALQLRRSGWTQKAIANLIGCSARTVRWWELGQRHKAPVANKFIPIES